jgi:alpha-glucosidase
MASVLIWAAAATAAALIPRQFNSERGDCPGYIASNAVETATGLTADLILAGSACNVYGTDIEAMTISVNYDNGVYYYTMRMQKNG